MPRKWTNHGSGGYGKHLWTGPTPVHTVDLRVVDEVFELNAALDKQEKNETRRRLRNGQRRK